MRTGRDTYTHGHHDAVLRSHRWRTVENSAAYLEHWLRPGARLLDVGCGPGTLTVDLARRLAPGQVLGIDISAEVVQEARDHAQAAGVGNVSFVSGDFRDAGLEATSFDVVHAHQVLQHLREPVEALAAMGRLARPDGVVAAREAAYSAMTWAPPDERLDRWREVYLAVTRRNGADADAGRWLLRWGRAAGLGDLRYTTSTWTFATPAERGWWGGLWADRTTGRPSRSRRPATGSPPGRSWQPSPGDGGTGPPTRTRCSSSSTASSSAGPAGGEGGPGTRRSWLRPPAGQVA